MKKRVLSLVLVISIIASLFVAMPMTASASATISIGDYVQMGTYYGKPILWRCVDIDENGPLMLSDKIICLKAFDGKGTNTSGSHGRGYYISGQQGYYRRNYGSSYWADSNIRDWLNSSASAGNVTWSCGNAPTSSNMWSGYNAYNNEAGFLTNFTQSERSAMKTVTQKSLLDGYEHSTGSSNTRNSNYHQYSNNISSVVQNYATAYSEQVTDTMFLLDVKQINEVYNNRSILGNDYYIGTPTAEAVANSEYKTSSLTSTTRWWSWLRSPYADDILSCGVRGVNSDGSVDIYSAYDGDGGVRPAFYLNLSSLNLKGGAGTAGNPYIVSGGGSSKIATYLSNTNSNGSSKDVSKMYLTSTYPENQSSGVPAKLDIRLSFNKQVVAAWEEKKLRIYDSKGNLCVSKSAMEAEFDGNSVVFENISLEKGKTYSVTVDSRAFDGDNCTFYGLEKGALIFTTESDSYSGNIKLSYPTNNILFFKVGENKDLPPIPKGSNSDYAKELKAWALEYGVDSVANYQNIEKLLDKPVKMPVTDTKGQTFLLNDGATTVKQVMQDLIFTEGFVTYAEKLDKKLHKVSSENTGSVDSIIKYDDEKDIYNEMLAPYADRINQYMKTRNEKSSVFMSLAAPIAYYSLITASSSLGSGESRYIKPVADATIERIALKNQISNVTNSSDYNTFKSNLSAIGDYVSLGKELYKIKTTGVSKSTASLTYDMVLKYFNATGTFKDNETLKIISETKSEYSKALKCVKLSMFLGTSLGCMGYVTDLMDQYTKDLSAKAKMFYFVADYYISKKYPELYNYCISDDFKIKKGQNILTDDSLPYAFDYGDIKNDAVALSWCRYYDSGVIQSTDNSGGYSECSVGARRDLTNIANLLTFEKTIDIAVTKQYLLKYLSAELNKCKSTEAYCMCPIKVNIYDKKDNLLATLSSEEENLNESENGSFYIMGDNDEVKCFVAASDEYRVEILPYDEGTMSIAVIQRDEDGKIINNSYFEDVEIIPDVGFQLDISSDLNTLTNLVTEENVKEDAPYIDKVEIICKSEIPVGESTPVSVRVYPEFCECESLEWKVLDENREETDNALVTDGQFSASEDGKYILQVIADDCSDELEVTAYSPITSINTEFDEITMLQGEEYKIEVTVNEDASEDRALIWSSSNENIAMVDQDGNVSAISTGEAIITCYQDNAKLEVLVGVSEYPAKINIYQSDTEGRRMKLDVVNLSSSQSITGSIRVDLKDALDTLVDTATIPVEIEPSEEISTFISIAFLTEENAEYKASATLLNEQNEEIQPAASGTFVGQKYTITFYDGEEIILEESVTSPTEVVFPTPPEKTYCRFEGFYSDSEFLNEVTEEDEFTDSAKIYLKYTSADEYNEYLYFVNDDTVSIVGYQGDEELMFIPSRISGYRVTEIEANAFKDCTMSEVVVPYSVTVIGQNAFDNCEALEIIYCERTKAEWSEVSISNDKETGKKHKNVR